MAETRVNPMLARALQAGRSTTAKRKLALRAGAFPVWLPIPMLTLLVLGLAAYALLHDGLVEWTDVLIPGILGGLLLLAMLIWLSHWGRVQRALRQQEAHYRGIYEHSLEGIYQTAPEGRWISANPALARMLGYNSPEELIASTSDLNHQFYVQPGRREEFQHALESNEIVRDFESEIRGKDGCHLWISETARAVRDVHGTLLFYEGRSMDISARKEAEAAVREKHNLLRTLIDNLPGRVYVKDMEGRKIVTNLAEVESCGAGTMENVIGKTDFELYPAEMASQFAADDQAVLSSGIPLLNREEPGFDAQGGPAWISTTKVPLRDASGRIVGLVGIGLDITARKRTEQQLREEHQRQGVWIAELEQRTREIGLLNELSSMLQSCSTVEEAYGVIAEHAKWLFPADSGALYVICPSRNFAESVVSWGTPLTDSVVFQPEDCWGLRRGSTHRAESQPTQGAPGSQPTLFCKHIYPPLPSATLCVPLVAQGETIGVLHLRYTDVQETSALSGASPAAFSDVKLQLAQAVAGSLAVAISNLRLRQTLREQSIHDPLTGLFNRRYMEESLEREMRRSERLRNPLGVIMLDIDHFKNFNDVFGHEAGDAMLRDLGGYLSSEIRAEDIACRYGGEEFVLIMPDAPMRISRARAEHIRKGVKQLLVDFRGRSLGPITLSIGVAEYPAHGSAAESLIRAADAAMYRAKKGGRDRVRIADGSSVEQDRSRS